LAFSLLNRRDLISVNTPSQHKDHKMVPLRLFSRHCTMLASRTSPGLITDNDVRQTRTSSIWCPFR